MNLILNELSLPLSFSSEEIDESFNNLIILGKFLDADYDTKIKFHLNEFFLISDIGFDFFSRIYSYDDWELIGFFNSLIDCPTIEELIRISEGSGNYLFKVTTELNNIETEGHGLKAYSYLKENLTFIYSFLTHDKWEELLIGTKVYISEKRFNTTTSKNLSRNTLEVKEKFYHFLNLQFLKFKKWNPKETIFPFAKLGKRLYAEQYKAELLLSKDERVRQDTILRYGELFCKLNGYNFDENISSINSSPSKIRSIFSAGNGNKKRFLSLDVENGAIELCDYDGTHLGPINWEGTIVGIAKPDSHSIKLRK